MEVAYFTRSDKQLLNLDRLLGVVVAKAILPPPYTIIGGPVTTPMWMQVWQFFAKLCVFGTVI